MKLTATTSNNSINNINNNFKRYVGTTRGSVVAVNPTRQELAELTGRNAEDLKEPVYTREIEIEGKKYQIGKVVFYMTIDTPDGPITTHADFEVRKQCWKSKSEKLYVIDEFGRTTWVTMDEFKKKEIPTFAKNGMKADISANYRECYRGEDGLVNFLKQWLNIIPTRRYDKETSKWVPTKAFIETPEKCQCSLDVKDLEKIYAGKAAELFKSFVGEFITNKVFVCAALDVTSDGKMYQKIFTDCFGGMSDGKTTTRSIMKFDQEQKDAGKVRMIVDPAEIHYFMPAASPAPAAAPTANPFAAGVPNTVMKETPKPAPVQEAQSFADDLPF